MRGPIRVASWPMQSGAISSSTASLVEATARKPKASPQPSNPLSVVTLTSSESAAGRLLSPQAEASDLLAALNGIRSGKVSMLVIIIFGTLITARALAPSTLRVTASDGADVDRRRDRDTQDRAARSPLPA